MTEGGREIIKLGGTTFCLCSLVYVCVSGNSAGLMSGNYTSPQATATQEQAQFPQSSRTSIIHNMFFCDDTAGSCQTSKRLFELPDHVTPQSPPQHTTTKREIISKSVLLGWVVPRGRIVLYGKLLAHF